MKKTELFLLLLVVLVLTFPLPSLSSSFYHDQNYYVEPKKQQDSQQEKLIFGEDSFEPLVSSEHGRINVLKAFPELSPLLNGIAKYRIGCYEADPLTFLVPTHSNADFIFYVAEGEGAITILREGKQGESHSLEKGDIIRVWAGSIFYLINKSKSQKFKLVTLVHSLENTGKFQTFHIVGRGEAQSYYRGFSSELLEAALNTKREQLQQLFGSQHKDVIRSAPEEKIRALAPRSRSDTGPWPVPISSRPFKMWDKPPKYKNKRGQLFEADHNAYGQLRDLNLKVTLTNISRGSMLAPFFNTRAFKLAVVVKGSGYVEIIYPEKEGRKQGSQTQQRYGRASSRLSEGSVFISPPDHPTAIVASKEQNLQIVCYEVQVENNELVFIAGKNNILGELVEAAKELAFGVPPRMVDEVLRGQEEEVFVVGPREWEKGGKRERPLMESVMEEVAEF